MRHVAAWTIHSLLGVMGVHTARFLYLVDIQTRPSEGPNVFPLNLTQIRAAVPEILDLQRKKSRTALKTEPYAVY